MKDMSGIVKWFEDKKGFGFIESQGKEYFVHFSAIQKGAFKTLNEGQKVTFDAIKIPKGDSASNVRSREV